MLTSQQRCILPVAFGWMLFEAEQTVATSHTSTYLPHNITVSTRFGMIFFCKGVVGVAHLNFRYENQSFSTLLNPKFKVLGTKFKVFKYGILGIQNFDFTPKIQILSLHPKLHISSLHQKLQNFVLTPKMKNHCKILKNRCKILKIVLKIVHKNMNYVSRECDYSRPSRRLQPLTQVFSQKIVFFEFQNTHNHIRTTENKSL